MQVVAVVAAFPATFRQYLHIDVSWPAVRGYRSASAKKEMRKAYLTVNVLT